MWTEAAVSCDYRIKTARKPAGNRNIQFNIQKSRYSFYYTLSAFHFQYAAAN